jgi:transcriptional regulator with XRE-family HTH domain
MAGGGSVVVRRQLGLRLRALREAAGKSLADVAEAGLGSPPKISRIETGKGPTRIADIRALCWLYGADAATTDALAALAPGTKQDGWWEQRGRGVEPEWFGLYAGLEASASRIRTFDPDLVHGLLQTREYAAAVIGGDPRLAPEVVERRVEFRMERQRTVLDNDAAPEITAIMAEATILSGSRSMMDPQIEHLRRLSSRPNIDIRLLPLSVMAYPRRGRFILFDFPDKDDPSIAYVEVPSGAQYFDQPAERDDYEYVFDLINGKSIPIKEWNP